MELGKAYEDVSDAYIELMNFEEALQFCLKALEIHVNQTLGAGFGGGCATWKVSRNYL